MSKWIKTVTTNEAKQMTFMAESCKMLLMNWKSACYVTEM